MLFSIIIPTFNNNELLTRCLNSLLDIDLKNNEIIIIDDGSIRNQIEYVPNYFINKKNFKFIRQENYGLSEAKNIGIKNSKGNFLIFLDGDDYIKKDEFNLFYKTILNKQYILEYDLIRVGFYRFNGSKIKKTCSKKEKDFKLKSSKYIFYVLILCKILAFSSWTHIYNRKFIVDNHLFFKKEILAEDLEHMIRAYDLINNVYVYSGAYYFYDNTNNNSITKTKKTKIAENIISFINMKSIHNNQLKSFLIIWYLLNFLPKYKRRIKNIEKVMHKLIFWIFNFNNSKK